MHTFYNAKHSIDQISGFEFCLNNVFVFRLYLSIKYTQPANERTNETFLVE